MINIDNMKKLGLVTEEGADLPQDIVQKHQIAVAPIKLDWPELENIPGENTFKKMRELERRGIKSFGKTSQPSPKDFLKVFRQQLERFEQIVCITLTSKLSGTYNSAIQAKNFLKPEEQKRVFIIDSLNASCGESLIVLKAIDLIQHGKPTEEILEELRILRSKVHLFAIIEDPKWLEASGRISSTLSNWLRRMAKIGIRPLIGIKKGVAVAIGVITGAKDIPTALLKQFKKNTARSRKKNKRIRIVITHGDNLKGAKRLKNMIEENLDNIEVAFINIIDNVLGVIVGPNVIACAWCEI